MIVRVTRGELVESVHEIAACVADARGAVIWGSGDIERPVYLRSAAKPFIAAAIVASGAAADANAAHLGYFDPGPRVGRETETVGSDDGTGMQQAALTDLHPGVKTDPRHELRIGADTDIFGHQAA